VSLDSYDVIRELGRGGMAAVHLARQRDLGRLVALKELGGFSARDPAIVERFLRESKLSGSLNHPNIVTVYEAFENDGTPYIAMELIEGGSLRPLIGELSLPRVARVLEDVLAAVGYAGRAGIVHRDIKPENTLITKDGRVKVADFGIAKAAASGQQGLTTEGMTVGTPEYMSPEQARGKGVTPASDLYSIGIMTYEMLTGRLPFTGDTQGALLIAHVSEEMPDVRKVDPLIPEAIAQWVARMTEKDADDRFEDAGAAWEAFEEAVLEFVGPLWRRDATLEPASEIDLSSIPPQTDQPRARQASAEPIPGGYQTYQAPAALHELLEDAPGSTAPGVTTPGIAAAPAARPVPRRATPAPVPVATVGAPAVADKPVAAPEEPATRPLPVGAIAGGAVVVAIIAFVVGLSGGGSAAPASATSTKGFVLKAPVGWKPATAGALAALPASDTALAPPGAPAGEAIAADRLPAARYGSLVRPGSALSHVKLGAGEAVRITGGGPTLYVLPTDAGLVVVGCSTGAAVSAACAASAGSLELTRGRAVAPGPTDDGARALNGALTRLKQGVRNPTVDLARAHSASAQATAASDLSRAFRTASTTVRRAPVGALANGARNQLAAALAGVASGWTSYARASGSANAAGVSKARQAVSRARTRVASARSALAKAGYSGGGG
jgi:serine/threonine protein kinase